MNSDYRFGIFKLLVYFCQNIIFFSFIEPKQPGVYADVFKAVPWITEQMSKN
jgi:hypothetical protein